LTDTSGERLLAATRIAPESLDQLVSGVPDDERRRAMAEPIIFVDTFAISEGKVEDLKQIAKEMVELVQVNEPRVLVYHIYIDGDARTMTGVQMHPDSASIETHFAVAGPHFGKVMECLEGHGTMNVFGSPSEAVRQQMTQMAGSMGIKVNFRDLTAGFGRLAGA
jgi:hypothetical protein